MSEIEVTQDTNVVIVQNDDAQSIVVTLDAETDVIQTFEQGPPGPQGPQGTDGANGKDGNTVLYGNTDPTSGVGVSGNFYINTVTHFMFGPKQGTVWPAGTSLIGPQGEQGIQGIQGVAGNTVRYGAGAPSALVGVDGDFYINTTNNFIYGPKAAGAWPAGVSLVGPQGPKGDTGLTGPASFPDAPADGKIYGRKDATWTLAGSSVLVSDTPPVGALDNSLWYESDTGLLYIRLRDADSSQWVIVPPGSAITADSINAVAYTPQTRTPTEHAQARKNIFAAPFDAMSHNGMQINGSMEVRQMIGGEATVSGTYALDMYQLRFVGTMAARMTRASQTAPLGGAGIPGYFYHLAYWATVAQPTMGVNDQAQAMWWIEGRRTRGLRLGTAGAQPFTIGFWSCHDIPGLYSVVCRNSSVPTFTCAMMYSHTTAGVAQWNALTFPAANIGDATNWSTDTDASLSFSFAVAMGSNLTTSTIGAWHAGNFMAGAGQVNGVAAANKYARFTGIIVLAGTEAPSALNAPNSQRYLAEEWQLTQRYLEYVRLAMHGYTPGGGYHMGYSQNFLIEKRVTPTLSLGWNGSNNWALDPGNPTATPTNIQVIGNAPAGGTTMMQIDYWVDARF